MATAITWRRLLTRASALFALMYLAACAYLYVRQRDLLYFPALTKVDPAETDIALARPGATLRGWIVHPDRPDPILYFGGNAERIEDNRADFARMFPDRSVYLVAHRGYGASDGTPTQDALVDDALAVYAEVRRRHPGQRIAVIGRSLGSGVAAQLAVRVPVDRLVLITPFDSLVATAQAHYPMFPVTWLLKDRYESDRALRTFERPLLIIHAGRDTVVPEAQTERLIATLPQPPQVVRIDAADHNDITSYADYERALADFLRRDLR